MTAGSAPAPSEKTSRQRTKRSPTAKGATKSPVVAARTPPHPGPMPEPDSNGRFGLNDPRIFLNRELTWLSFNFRVLKESENVHTPLLERVKFLSIVSSNLDEFFMKRIGGLKQQVGAGLDDKTADGRTPQQQIDDSYVMVRELESRKRATFLEVVKSLKEKDIALTSFEDLPKEDREHLREFYIKNIFPLVTPQATDPAHPFPFVSNLSLNLLVSLHHPGDPTPHLARVKVPVGAGTPRLLKLKDSDTFVTLESVMANNLDLLFPGMEVDTCELFRVTRNANTDVSEEHADDLLATIETGLRERKFAPIVRLEVAKGMLPHHRGMLAAELELDENADVFEVEGMMAMRDLMGVLQVRRPALHDAPFHPADHPLMVTDRNIFHVIRDHKTILLHHPYQSFATSVERLLREASQDPKVRAIKMTLYRTSEDAKIIGYLVDAARNGKQVAVVVELKARFDEEANIRWAKRLEDVGIHVTYGVVGLKTHCKAILVVRRDYDELRRYAHIGTGNYHSGTARLYCDLGMLTCDERIGSDLTELFNYLTTGYKPKRNYQALLPAPKIAKPAILEKIEREAEHARAKRPARIQIKVNALTDLDVIRALFTAAEAGVHIDLIVRDSCCLRPGVPGLSENIHVVSVVGRFLEHARVWYFENGGDEEYYIGSADAMKRNLDDRVEILGPVWDPVLRSDLRMLLDLQLGDQHGAWDMHADGRYVQRVPEDVSARHVQDILIDLYQERFRDATRLRRRKPRGLKSRNLR